MDLRVIKASADQCASAFTKAMREAVDYIHPQDRGKKTLQQTHPALMALMDAITLMQMEVGSFGAYLEPHDEREGAPTKGFRKFVLIRSHDVTGVSGTGVIAEGVQFADGSVVLRWRGDTPSTITYASADDALQVHGHGGHTRIMWLDGAAVVMEQHAHEYVDSPKHEGKKHCLGCGDLREFTEQEFQGCNHTTTVVAIRGVIRGRKCVRCGGFKGDKDNWGWVH